MDSLKRFSIPPRFISRRSVKPRKFALLVILVVAYYLLWIWILAVYGGDLVSSFFTAYALPANTNPGPAFMNKPANFLISTSNCKIPELPAWTPEARILLEKKCSGEFKGPPKCTRNPLHSWGYVNGLYLHINLTAVMESGYSWKSIRCCYREIIRVEQEFNTSDMNADKVVRYSDECYPVQQPRQEVTAQFIRLYCISTTFPTFGSVVSRQFFAIAKPDSIALSKMNTWRKFSKNATSARPSAPHIIILGVDSMSRLGSLRNFPKTIEILQSLDAVEMKVYNKIGQTTYPNTVAFLAGHTLSEITNYCYRELSEPQDNCPYLWKAFNQVGYLTTTMEDSSRRTAFNFLKRGFIRKPVDFYLRPFVLTVMKYLPRTHPEYIRCLAGRQVEEVLLKYLTDILELAKPSNTPVFAHVWIAGLSHQCTTTPKYSDRLLATTVQNLIKRFNNTILIFMGDHGEAFGEFRETLQGWYEDHLPMFWIYLPDDIRRNYPQWQRSLEINSNRLTSHFDLYKTMVHVLQTYDTKKVAWETYDKLTIQRGQSLFIPVPENRSCQMAGIPEGYCVCSPPMQLDVNNKMSKKVASFAVEYIAKLLPLDACERPVLKEIKSIKSFQTPAGSIVYLFTFIIDPGEFLLEATIKEDLNENGKLEVTKEMLRINTMAKKMNCMTKDPSLEKLCYCK